jgi:hypothetical protein
MRVVGSKSPLNAWGLLCRAAHSVVVYMFRRIQVVQRIEAAQYIYYTGYNTAHIYHGMEYSAVVSPDRSPGDAVDDQEII